MSAGNRFGGHLVTGHIDGVGPSSKKERRRFARLIIEVSPSLARYIVGKSRRQDKLDVNEQRDNIFTVNIIPYTVSRTTIGAKNLRDAINIETDIIESMGEFLTKTKVKVSTRICCTGTDT
jgi:riboflavin synthase